MDLHTVQSSFVPLYSHSGRGSLLFQKFFGVFIVFIIFSGSHRTFCAPTVVTPAAATTEVIRPTCGQACEYEEHFGRAHCDQRRLTFVPIPTGCEGVTLLELQENNITSITREQMSRYTLVRTFDISRNQISSFEPGTFLHNRRMKNIFASFNKLQNLLRGTFNGTEKSMQRIYLDNNNIHTIENGTFFGLDKLQVLHLQQNRLQEVPVGLFADLVALNHVNLSNNQLQDIPPPAELGFSNLRQLDLQNNQLHDCATIVPFLYNITDGFYLSGNPLVCDCNFLTIQKWFYETNHPQNSQIGCTFDNETYFDVKDNLTLPCAEPAQTTYPQETMTTQASPTDRISTRILNIHTTSLSLKYTQNHVSSTHMHDDYDQHNDHMEVSRYVYRVPWISYYTAAILTLYAVFRFLKWICRWKKSHKQVELMHKHIESIV